MQTSGTPLSRVYGSAGTSDTPAVTAGHRSWLQWALVALIFVACALFLDLGAVAQLIRRVPLGWILFILVLMTADRLLMAWKWSVLLRALKVKVPFPTLASFYYQGTFTGIFLPSGLGGDLLRAHWVSRSVGVTHQVYASLLMEKMIGFLSAMNWALIGTAVFSFQFREMSVSWIITVLAGTLLMNGLFLLSLQPRLHNFILLRFTVASQSQPFRFFQRLFKAYCHYGNRPGVLAWNGLLTVAEHALQMLIFLAMARSLGIDAGAVPFLAVTAIHLVIYRLPISPDGWGVGEATAIGIYSLIGISPESAFALAFLAHVLQTIVVLPGIWFLWRSR